MKYLKLVICFVVLLAIVVGVVFLSGGSKGAGRDGVNPEFYNRIDSIIDAEWGNSDVEWSSPGFDKMQSKINTYRKELGRGYVTLLDKFHGYALARLYKTTMEQYAKDDCYKDSITKLNSDLSDLVVSAQGRFDKNNKVKTLKDVNALYNKALELQYRYKHSFPLHIQYEKIKKHKRDTTYYYLRDANRTKMADLKALADTTFYYTRDANRYLNGYIKSREDIINNSLYIHLRNIDIFEEAFEEKAFNDRINLGRENFKKGLEKDILKAFKDEIPSSYLKPEADSGRLEEMERIKSRLYEQYKILCDTRDEFLSDFDDEVPRSIKSLIENLKEAYEEYEKRILETKRLIESANDKINTHY